MSDCVFCKIVKGEIPATKIYENEHVLAFLDIMPVNSGHTLVIPKIHFKDVFESPDDILKEMIIAVKKIAPAVMKSTDTQAFNLNLNNGEDAGQVVKHVHFHIIPRFTDDGKQLWSGGEYKNDEEKNQLADTIRQALE